MMEAGAQLWLCGGIVLALVDRRLMSNEGMVVSLAATVEPNRIESEDHLVVACVCAFCFRC